MLKVMIWWLALILIGMAFWPPVSRLFRHFQDGGWLFSKTIGLFVSAWLTWALNCAHWLKFSQAGTAGVLLAFAVLSYGGCALYDRKKGEKGTPLIRADWRLALLEEGLFTAVFFISVWILGFNPDAYGTEKFMDYAFLTAMVRSDYMPFADPWFAGEAINYYYGGQYITAWLIRLTGCGTGYGYNLMRAAITAGSFALPFPTVFQLMTDLLAGNESGERRLVPLPARAKKVPAQKLPASRGPVPFLAGLAASFAVAFAGNCHYIIFGLLIPLKNRITGTGGDYFYWFPDTTRYIGYDPDLPDKTIHEFPAYSSVLGDLHAHYINLLFVITVVGILYAWVKNERKDRVIRQIFAPELLLLGLFTGVFRWTNFWDLPIYYVVTGCIVLFFNILQSGWKPLKAVGVTLLEGAVIFLLGAAAALPFTAAFDMISSEVHLTHSHTLLFQLLILWGLPALTLILLGVRLVRENLMRKRAAESSKEKTFPVSEPDLFVFLLGLCAAGLVFLPEAVYVRDIYEGDFYRANTMFKLTYQAFVMFGMVLGYALMRGLALGKGFRKAAAAAGICVLALNVGYTGTAVKSWFGDVFDADARRTLDATSFVDSSFSSDYGAISWLNDNIEGHPTVLEAPGDSYSDNCRVSVVTGLPTVIGWHTHEWLWRSDVDAVNGRFDDVQRICTSTDRAEVEDLIRLYRISYIYVGNLEREKYPDINEILLFEELGELVYADDNGTYIVDVRSYWE